MTSLDPLKSVISIGNVDDTSLAVPSVNQYGTGQQRVLEQVQTIRRTKSRQFSSRSGSASLSPTSKSTRAVDTTQDTEGFGDVSHSVSLLCCFHYKHMYSLALQLSLEKSMNRQPVNFSKGSSVKMNRAASTYHYERSYAPVSSIAVGQTNTTRSEPDLAWQHSVPKRSVPLQRFLSSRGTHRTDRSTSQYITTNMGQLPSFMNGTSQIKTNNQFIYVCINRIWIVIFYFYSYTTGIKEVADITMKEAVECLSSDDETFQHCGASYIQHNTFIDDKAKDEVLQFDGIPPLVGLLQSPNSQVSQTASAALRNLSFKNNSAKEAIHRSGGITEAAALLRDTDSVEIQKQLTGLLWNLSSTDDLKPDLLKSALPVLMERVILPYTTGPNRATQDPELFFNATGCLRMHLVKLQNTQDSLVLHVPLRYVLFFLLKQSVENCVCILHNLTFQLEAEAPTLFSRITALAKTVNRRNSEGETGPIGCFNPQSKSPDQERHFDFPVVEDPQPTGAGWLFHSKTLQSYLNLLESSKREETQEACCGALQNLTAQEGIVSCVMSQAIVQKLNGLQVISPLLKSNKVSLQRNTVALVGNLTKNPNLHNALGKNAGTKQGNESDDTLAMAYYPRYGETPINRDCILYFPKASKVASLFLYNLWSEKDLQSFLKKQGMSKASFVNDITTTALKSVQVVH
uniref:Plakophilin-1-like n=1 Tax=Seriola dumerili TaxID=41447 RepID=A0A3B4T3E1_SERDU